MDNCAASQDELLSGPQGQSQKLHFKNQSENSMY